MADPVVGDEPALTKGFTVIRDHYDADLRFENAGTLVARLLLEDTRHEMLAVTEGRAAWEYQWAPGTIESSVTAIRLGTILSRRFALGVPRALLAHRDNALRYHQDTRQPYPCANLTLVFAHGCTGGELLFPARGLAFACQDAWALAFDGQELHGVAPLRLAKGGYRMAVTFYCPSEP